MGLFIPLWKSKKPGKKKKWIESKFNSRNADHLKILINLGKHDEDVGGLAIENLIDQNALIDIAKNSTHLVLRTKAINKINDLTILTDLAKHGENIDIKIAAISKLSDQIIISEIALNDRSSNVRFAALKMLTDQNLLANVIINSDDEFNCTLILYKIKDLTLLSNVAIKSRKKDIRSAATTMLKDQNILAEIAINDESEFVSSTATIRLNDKKLLQNVAKNAKHFEVRYKANEKLGQNETQESLADQAKYSKRKLGEDAEEAFNKITEVGLFADIAINAYWINVREAAINKINNKNILVDIAKNDGSVRKSVTKKLVSLFDELNDRNILIKTAKDKNIDYPLRHAAIVSGKFGDIKIVKSLLDEMINEKSDSAADTLRFLYHNASLTDEAKKIIFQKNGFCLENGFEWSDYSREEDNRGVFFEL